MSLLQCSLHAICHRFLSRLFQRQSFGPQPLADPVTHILMKRAVLEGKEYHLHRLVKKTTDNKSKEGFTNLQLYFNEGADTDIKLPIDEVHKVWKRSESGRTFSQLIFCYFSRFWSDKWVVPTFCWEMECDHPLYPNISLARLMTRWPSM